MRHGARLDEPDLHAEALAKSSDGELNMLQVSSAYRVEIFPDEPLQRKASKALHVSTSDLHKTV